MMQRSDRAKPTAGKRRARILVRSRRLSEEHMKHSEDLHIQNKVNDEYTKNTSKNEKRRNRANLKRTRSSKWKLKRKCPRRH